MAWMDDVRNCVDQLNDHFQLADLDPFIPRLHQLHPANQHIREKIRQQLQSLRDAGEIEFIAPGEYRKLGASSGLRIARESITTREEIASQLGIGKEALQRGMFKPSRGPFSNDLLLFSQPDNMYGDSFDEGDRILYVGQGQKGNQKLDGFNLALAQHLENGTRVHMFVKEQKTGKDLRYKGEMVLDRVERVYRDQEQRSVLEFFLIPDETGTVRTEFGKAYAEVLEESLEPSVAPRPRVTKVVRQTLRDKAFSTHIRKQYDNRCAVCGDTLRHESESWIDLQGAHVRSVASGGRDALNNGIALCARHHWAFDHGIFSLTDELRILTPMKFVDPNGEIHAGQEIALPQHPDLNPHPEYLRWHRANSQISA